MQIIEDDPLHAQLLDHSLRQARYRTNVAIDGVTGLADVKRLLPAIILLDLMLPGISGDEVCRDIRNTPGIQQTPIIMITALGSEEDRVGGIEMGADDYIAKPFSPRAKWCPGSAPCCAGAGNGNWPSPQARTPLFRSRITT